MGNYVSLPVPFMGGGASVGPKIVVEPHGGETARPPNPLHAYGIEVKNGEWIRSAEDGEGAPQIVKVSAPVAVPAIEQGHPIVEPVETQRAASMDQCEVEPTPSPPSPALSSPTILPPPPSLVIPPIILPESIIKPEPIDPPKRRKKKH